MPTTTSTGPATITTTAMDDLRQQLADALSMMERAEVIDFNGHMSCRLPGSQNILINAGKSVRSALTAADIIEIDLDGQPVGHEVVPPMEFHLHSAIYSRRPDVNAVAHTHPLWSTLFSSVGQAVGAAFLAGHAHANYRRAGGSRTQILADFIIAAHAAVTLRPLLTRDPRRVSTYLPGVELISP